jgi:pimeloyl-ACP methyl ester carboxylesterase
VDVAALFHIAKTPESIMNQKSAESMETSLAFVDHGEGPVLLLVHGFPLDHTMWQFQIDELSDAFRVIAVDLPGFGGSEPLDSSESDTSIRDYADALNSLLDQLGIDEPITFCGLSMGGYIGWQFLQHHRNRVSALIACDTRAAADDEKTARGRRLMAAHIATDGSASIAPGMASKICGATTAERQPEIIQWSVDTISATDPQSIATGQLAMADRPDATEWLTQIDVPALLIVGQEDQITPPAEMRAMADRIPGSKFVEIPHAGHLTPMENSVAFNEAVRAFLRSV